MTSFIYFNEFNNFQLCLEEPPEPNTDNDRMMKCSKKKPISGTATLKTVTRAQGLKGAHLGKMFKDLRRFLKNFPSLKLINPRAGAIVTRGHYFNNLGKGTLGDTTYQISKLYA